MSKVGKRKSKRTRKQPKCTICNPFRWLGNSKNRHRHSYYKQQKEEAIKNSNTNFHNTIVEIDKDMETFKDNSNTKYQDLMKTNLQEQTNTETLYDILINQDTQNQDLQTLKTLVNLIN